MILVSSLAGVVFVGGLIMLVLYFRPAPPKQAPTKPSLSTRWGQVSKKTKTSLIIGGILGIVAAIISGFPVMVIVVPAAITIVPALLGKPSTYERDLILALENWARSLASTADTGAFTLREVIGITQGSVPQMLKAPVNRLYTRMSSSWSTADALRAFADELDNSHADEVTIYLIQAAEFNAGGLSKALESVSEGLSATAKQKILIEGERKKPRETMISMTWIVGITLVMLVFFAGTGNMDFYRTPLGGVALGLILSSFVGLMVWARAITRVPPEPRFLSAPVSTEVGA